MFRTEVKLNIDTFFSDKSTEATPLKASEHKDYTTIDIHEIDTPLTPVEDTKEVSKDAYQAHNYHLQHEVGYVFQEINAEFPDDYWQAIQKSAIQGTLFSFLTILTEELVSKQLAARGYQSKEIYLINQTLQSLKLLAGGTSMIKVVALPVANYLLIELGGIKSSTASNITTSAFIAADAFINPASLATNTITLGVAVGHHLFSHIAAKKSADFIHKKLKTEIDTPTTPTSDSRSTILDLELGASTSTGRPTSPIDIPTPTSISYTEPTTPTLGFGKSI